MSRKSRKQTPEVLTLDSDWTVKADDQVVICRGWGHHFPHPFDFKRQKVRGKVEPQRDGSCQIVQTCSYGCKTTRTLLLPGGRIDGKNSFSYVYKDPNYKAPKGTRIAPWECKLESMRRAQDYI
jgi:hypothetical protein